MTNFEKETCKAYSQRQLKNRWDVLKKEWKAWKKLKDGDTGLGWNPIKRTVDASDDCQKRKTPDISTSCFKTGKKKSAKQIGEPARLSSQIEKLCNVVDNMSQATSSLIPVMDLYGNPQAVKVFDSMSEEIPEASPLYFFSLRLLLKKDKRIIFLSINPKMRVL
ncbi:hypothetical protein GOBAR_DD00700 [Gossypium barbadense]|nr:hypothetical protein GOBAR_DD00700 [Gossypium barbadense]